MRHQICNAVESTVMSYQLQPTTKTPHIANILLVSIFLFAYRRANTSCDLSKDSQHSSRTKSPLDLMIILVEKSFRIVNFATINFEDKYKKLETNWRVDHKFVDSWAFPCNWFNNAPSTRMATGRRPCVREARGDLLESWIIDRMSGQGRRHGGTPSRNTALSLEMSDGRPMATYQVLINELYKVRHFVDAYWLTMRDVGLARYNNRNKQAGNLVDFDDFPGRIRFGLGQEVMV